MDLSKEQIQGLARQARDDGYYDKIYSLYLFNAGEMEQLKEVLTGSGSSFSKDLDLGDYPEIDPPIYMQGVQNHALLNSRINVQGLVYALPEITLNTPNPTIREIQKQFLLKRWEEGLWPYCFYEMGMEVEAGGISFAEIGINEDGRVDVQHRSVLDVLWDRTNKTPSQWRYFFTRNRMDLLEAQQKYPSVPLERLEALATDLSLRWSRRGIPEGASNKNGYGECKIIYEWNFWTPKQHAVFLGSIQGDHEFLALGPSENAGLAYETADAPGPNPFGTIPISVWVDSFVPGVARPVSKLETSWRSISMLNALELAMRNNVRRNFALTFFSTLGLSDEVIEILKKAKGPDDVGLYIPYEGDLEKAIQHLPAQDMPTAWMHAIEYYRNQINAATGVMDTQRGQPLPGERTALEVRTLHASQGVQARHSRNRYAAFLKMLMEKVLHIAARYDTAPTVLSCDFGPVDSSRHPLQPFLEIPSEVYVNEASLEYFSTEDQKQRRLQQFQLVDLPAIQMGVDDTMKVFADVYKQIGLSDPMSLMFTPEEIQRREMLVESMMAGESSGQEGAQDEPAREPNPSSRSGGERQRALPGDNPAPSPVFAG